MRGEGEGAGVRGGGLRGGGAGHYTDRLSTGLGGGWITMAVVVVGSSSSRV